MYEASVEKLRREKWSSYWEKSLFQCHLVHLKAQIERHAV